MIEALTLILATTAIVLIAQWVWNDLKNKMGRSR